jgi:hypothetical protein
MSCLLIGSGQALAIGTAFVYQGTLEDGGQLANGTYDFQFRVVNASTGISGFVFADNVVTTGGVFTVTLDFGAGIFTGADRFLEIGVRPGTSTGAYTILSPNTPIHPAPYAQRSTDADSAFSAQIADDVIANAIDSSDIANGSVTASDIADGTVDTAELADGAVTVNKVASGTLTMSRFAGGFGNYSLSASISANACSDFSVTFGGDIDTDDFPIIAMRSDASLPNNMSITALRVSAANTVEVRICNAGNATASFSNLGVKLLTVR